MQKLLDAAGARLREFVAQRDDLALVVTCTDADAVIVLKLLEELEDAATSEMVWVVTEDFADPVTYTNAVVNAFAAKCGAVSLALRDRKVPPWPPVPASAFDETRDPAERLRHLMAFSRSLLPVPDGMVAVWCIHPANIQNPAAYTRLVGDIIAHEFPDPWCHDLRFIVRALRGEPTLPAALRPRPHLDWFTTDFSQEAMARAIDEEADDESLPLERRLQSLFVSANLDYAHQRPEAALEKYEILLKYHTGEQNATMTALVLNGMGEVHARLGNREQAADCFERALIPASSAAGPPIPVLLNLSLNLGNLRLEEGNFAAAEAYFDSAQQFATIQRAAITKVQAMEKLGYCQYSLGNVDAALRSWTAAATVAEQLELRTEEMSVRRYLHSHYASVGDDARAHDAAQRLSLLQAPTHPIPA
jgi:tetratricopeptide (TPR) repeat protein